MILLIYVSLLSILTRTMYLLSKHNSGKFKCTTITGRILGHYFSAYCGRRVCSICGLVQKEGPAGILMRDGDTWYDEGYAENKETLAKHYLEQKLLQEEKYRKWDEDRRREKANKKIRTPVHKVATKEDEKQ